MEQRSGHVNITFSYAVRSSFIIPRAEKITARTQNNGPSNAYSVQHLVLSPSILF